MALDFPGAGSDRVETASLVPTAAGATNNDITWMFWVNIDDMVDNQRLWDGSGNNFIRITSAGATTADIQVRVNQATAFAQAVTNTTLITEGIWQCVAVTYDEDGVTTRVRVYASTRTGQLTESTYSVNTAGVGEYALDATWKFGGDTGTNGLNGRIAMVGVWNRLFTQTELRIQQRFQRPVLYAADCKCFMRMGFEDGLGTQRDWSIAGNNGTIVGSPILGNHVPLPTFGPAGSWN